MTSVCLVFALTAVAVAVDDDLVTNLPGLSVTPPFRQYSGYIAVDDSDSGVVVPGANTRYLHYWFVESQRNPAEDPVIFWTNGGPGCSGLLGFMTEHGPFRAGALGQTLTSNPYSWNRVANMLYIEQPSGVGFSYGGNLTSGDSIAQHDNWRFVVGFFQRYPQFVRNAFYVSGESFGGNYVPELAYKILQMNEAGKSSINLKGFLVGNPTGINSNSWSHGYTAFMRNHALLSDEEDAEIAKACENDPNSSSEPCNAALDKYYNLNWYGVNPYNVIAPCIGFGPAKDASCAARKLGAVLAAGGTRTYSTGSQTFVPCSDFNSSIAYLNRPDVRAALHISPRALRWDVCSDHLNYTSYLDPTPMYRSMFGKLRIFVYSGDQDSCVPYITTQDGVRGFGRPRLTPFQRWMYNDSDTKLEQVAGSIEQYHGITFATVRGAGHMVPTDKPQVALELLRLFLGERGV